MEWFDGWRSEALYALAALEVLNLFMVRRVRLLMTAKVDEVRRDFARRLHPEHFPHEQVNMVHHLLHSIRLH